MPKYNLLKYRKKNKQTAGSLWSYYRDEPSNPLSINSESFKYKTSITGNTYNVGDGEDNYDANKFAKNETEIVIWLKYLNNFWRTLNIPLINCEICVLADMTERDTWNNNGPPAIVAPTGLEFQIKDTKDTFQLSLLSTESDKKLLEQLKSRF